MINKDWFFYYSLLKKYYEDLLYDGYITDDELVECLDFMHVCTLGEMQEECVKLGIVDFPCTLLQ